MAKECLADVAAADAELNEAGESLKSNITTGCARIRLVALYWSRCVSVSLAAVSVLPVTVCVACGCLCVLWLSVCNVAVSMLL